VVTRWFANNRAVQANGLKFIPTQGNALGNGGVFGFHRRPATCLIQIMNRAFSARLGFGGTIFPGRCPEAGMNDALGVVSRVARIFGLVLAFDRKDP
jgi:hypothetical protein